MDTIDSNSKDKLLGSIEKLYRDMDKCVSELVSARTKHSEAGEGMALFKMESLFVSAQQELSFIHDYLKHGTAEA